MSKVDSVAKILTCLDSLKQYKIQRSYAVNLSKLTGRSYCFEKHHKSTLESSCKLPSAGQDFQYLYNSEVTVIDKRSGDERFTKTTYVMQNPEQRHQWSHNISCLSEIYDVSQQERCGRIASLFYCDMAFVRCLPCLVHYLSPLTQILRSRTGLSRGPPYQKTLNAD